MKNKVLFLVYIVIVIFCLCSCSDKKYLEKATKLANEKECQAAVYFKNDRLFKLVKNMKCNYL